MHEKKWGWAGVYKAEIVEVLHDIPKGLRWSEIFDRINKNRAAQSKVPMSANTLQKYLDVLFAEDIIEKTVLSHNNVVYSPTPKMGGISIRFQIGAHIMTGLALLGSEVDSSVFEGLQRANKQDIELVSFHLRAASNLIDKQKL